MKELQIQKNEQYKDCGGRGIRVCHEWVNSYEEFKKWALSSGYKEHLTIERINNDGNYNPDNCRWATRKEQSNNKRRNRRYTYNNETLTIAQWSEKSGISYDTLYFRLTKYGMDIEKAITMPIKNTRRKIKSA